VHLSVIASARTLSRRCSTCRAGPSSTTATVYCFTRAGAGSGDCDDLTLIRQPS